MPFGWLLLVAIGGPLGLTSCEPSEKKLVRLEHERDMACVLADADERANGVSPVTETSRAKCTLAERKLNHFLGR